ncbi:MAG: glycosyltransferase family 4 protein [Gemmatimonadales bacterium]
MRTLVLSHQCHDPANRDRLRAIAALGVDVVLAIPGGTTGSDGGIRLVPVPVRGDAALPDSLRWHIPTLRRVLAEIGPTLVHIEAEPDTPLAVAAASVCKRIGVPYVLFGWRSTPRSFGFLTRRRIAGVLRHANGVIGANRLAMDLLHQRAPQALAAAIPSSGIVMGPMRVREGHQELVIGFAGRLVVERGADLLLGALGQTFGQWRAVIAGTGPEQERLEATVQRLGLAARVRWLGGLRAETIEQLWQGIDCLVVPSRDTPSWVDHQAPLLLDAMARGIAPVVTRAGALPELVGRAGPVVANEAELAEALQRWVSEPELCRASGAAARQWVMSRYTSAVIAERTVGFWQAVAEHATPAGISAGPASSAAMFGET